MIFDNMNAEQITKILAITEKVNFPAGEIIFKQETEPDGFYIVIEGEVSLVKINDIGKDTELTVVGKGSFIGEISALDEKGREITAIAVSDVVAFRISKEKLDIMQKVDYPVLVKFYLSIIRDINEKLRRINDEYSRIKEKLQKNI
ncbi:MAG: cyclic nucleotide-binding domain-containing protein [Candidatus Muirbacterium halophilum]|nr:cyclic nucleotide-binding domain-containing protein [Candidatus Muirbacterium halophilum]MCK9474958.1 cyclic nucleotide-binding domain-containing protein [Candidatus Muirbacterium halophilum]